MGDASYSLYLLHILVLTELFRAEKTLGDTQAFLLLSACYALTVILSLLCYRYFERPMADLLKRHTLYSRQSMQPLSEAHRSEPLTD